ncbi:hypothetical protein, partial [Aeromonas veronii]|uniref:hypothetical protein n=1 Tax=Aeromonas veronii TaxID=654 RepID=UPI0030075D95
GDKIRSQTKPFLYLFQLVGAKDPVHEVRIAERIRTFALSPLSFQPSLLLPPPSLPKQAVQFTSFIAPYGT